MASTTPSNAVSLSEYVAKHGGPTTKCLLCNVPYEVERQAQQGRAAQVPFRLICKWLESLDESYGNVTKGRIEKHFYDGHTHPDAPKDAK